MNIISRQIKEYIKHVLKHIFNEILSENNVYMTSVGDGDMDFIFSKVYEKLDELPRDYLENVFYPVIKN